MRTERYCAARESLQRRGRDDGACALPARVVTISLLPRYRCCRHGNGNVLARENAPKGFLRCIASSRVFQDVLNLISQKYRMTLYFKRTGDAFNLSSSCK